MEVSKGLFIKIGRISLVFTLAMFLQLAFYWYSVLLAQNFTQNFSVLVKSDESLSSLSYLTKRLNEYESLDLIKCYTILDQNNFVLIDSSYKSECKSLFSNIGSVFRSSDLSLLSGSSINIKFRYRLPTSTFYLFQISWLVVCISAFLGIGYFQRKKDLQKKQIEEFNSQISKYRDISLQIVHDAKSPLSVLTLLSGSPGLSESMKDLLNLASTRIMEILNDLSMQKGEGATDIQESVRAVVREASHVYGARIDVNISNWNSEKLNLNKSYFERVISNIVTNAVQSRNKFDKPITVSLTSDKLFVYLSIEDQGCGIPREILEKIGKERITFGKKDGQGLGLSDAFRKVAEWDGTINVDSIRNKGTTVKIKIPKEQKIKA